MEELLFESLNQSHFALIHQWFNKPHIQAFYSLRPWTLEEVNKKLTPYLQGEKQIKGYMIYYEKQPVGYIQSYSLKECPWENQDLPDEVIGEAAGIDLFIGEEKYLGKGLGCEILNSFLEKYVWPYHRYSLADPDVRNEASIRLFQKCGFTIHKQIFSKDALHRNVTLQLFMKERAFQIILPATSPELEAINEAITSFNITMASELPRAKIHRLDFSAKNQKGDLLGGIQAKRVNCCILEIELIFVFEEHRHQGIASQLLHCVEQNARDQQCHLAHLDTFDFQAKDFYLKQGYSIFGILENAPKGHYRYYMKKEL